jgi:hypothetical protein
VRAFFCLQKKPSLTLNCAFIGEAFWLHLFLEKGGNASPRSPINKNLNLYSKALTILYNEIQEKTEREENLS